MAPDREQTRRDAEWFSMPPHELVRSMEYLAELRERLEDQQGIGRANVGPLVVLALLDSLKEARLSNLHNFEVAQKAMRR